ncbi:MAG: hypothetical protein K0R55_3728 [Sporomusa sp.]|nr:hypothetical protein [Sporomusa sp.]
MSETLFAYTITNAGYSQGTAGAINGDRSATTPAAFTAQKDKITPLNGDPAVFNFFDTDNQSRLVLRQYTYSTTSLLPNKIINPFAASWVPLIAEQTWNDVANLHTVATRGRWLYATGYDLARIAVVDMLGTTTLPAYGEKNTYQLPTAWPSISLPVTAQCHGEGLVVVGNNLYALFTVNPDGGYAVYSNSIVVKLSINILTGALTYVSHLEVGKNAFTLELFNNKLYVCALGGMQNAGSANADTRLDIIDLATFTKTSVSTIPSIVGDFRDITIRDASNAFIFVGHYDASFANLVGGIYHSSVANITSPVTWTKVVNVNSPGYLWGVYAETNRLWFIKGTPVEIFAPLPVALTPSPAKDFSASQMGNFGADANLNSATIVAPNPTAGAGVELQAAVAKSFAGHAILAQQARKAASEAAAGEEKK